MNILGRRNRQDLSLEQSGARRRRQKGRKGERWHAPNTKTAVLNRETGLKPLSISQRRVGSLIRSTASSRQIPAKLNGRPMASSVADGAPSDM